MELIKLKHEDILTYVNTVELVKKERIIEFEGRKDYKTMAFAIECYNALSKCHIARLSQRFAYDLPEELGVDKGSDKLYFSVVVTEQVHYGALVTCKDLKIPDLLEECLQNKNVVQLDVNENLKPLCLKLAYAKNVKVYNNPGNNGFYFSFDKVKSTYSKIKAAAAAGEKKISFHFDYVGEQTVRSYATRLKKETGAFSRVKVSGRITTLYFGFETELDLAEPDLRQLIYKYNGYISREQWENLFHEMMNECFEKQLPNHEEKEEWQRLGYDSEQEWSDHMKEKEEAASEDWKSEPAPDEWKEDDEWN